MERKCLRADAGKKEKNNMDKLLIIADDFTGSLDTGIQFCKDGVKAKVVSEVNYDFSTTQEDVSLIVINTDSRPLTSKDAYERVYTVAKNAVEHGIKYIYKKTDSGLRGNIGSELLAVLDATNQKALCFIPALPKLNRITKDGIAWINGVPVSQSVFGEDPFEPVQYDDIAEIINDQVKTQVVKVSRNEYEHIDLNPEEKTIYLFDAETEQDLEKIAMILKKNDCFTLCGGCAGFAGYYDKMITLDKSYKPEMIQTDGLLALCGSVNQITVDQLKYAGEHGFQRGNLTCEQKLESSYLKSDEGKKFIDELFETMQNNDRYALDTLDTPDTESVKNYRLRNNMTYEQCRFQIADTIGMIAIEMIRRGLNVTYSLTGGDTLMGLMRATGCKELIPVCEIGQGAVLNLMHWNGKCIQIISKSGGFGEKEIFNIMYETVKGEKR